jgi:hypothetical protein
MFPERAIPDVPTPSKKASDDDSFLSRHGGKVGLVALAVACGIFYTYYKSGQLKSEQEDELAKAASIEPYEINEFRFLNKMDHNKFNSLASMCLDKFPSMQLTYSEFVTFVRSYMGTSIRSGHILDRLILAKLESELNSEEEQMKLMQPLWSSKSTFPLPYFLVALNMAVDAPAAVRCDCLYNLGIALTAQTSSAEVIENIEEPMPVDLSLEQLDSTSTGN